MENNLVIGILNIVEDKLREFNIQIPADEREDSTDPIVGYHYAELHDQILEYLQEREIIKDHLLQENPQKVYAVSIVSSDGFANGNDSNVHMYASLRECIDKTYLNYVELWVESKDVFDDDYPLMTKAAFEKELLKNGNVCIQCLDSHINIEFFERQIVLSKEQEKAQTPGQHESMEAIIADVKAQLNNKESTTAYGEPQAFADLGHGRCIEVTLEQEGLDIEDYFFSVRLHCNDAEFDNGEFHSTAGVIDVYNTSGSSMDEIDELIIRACVCNKRHPVLDQYLSSGFVSLSDARSTGPHSKVSLSDQIASASIRTGATASASGMKRTGPESGR